MNIIDLNEEVDRRKILEKAKEQNQISFELKFAVAKVLERHGYDPLKIKSITVLNCALDDLVSDIYGDEGNLTGILKILSQILKEIEHTETANRMI